MSSRILAIVVSYNPVISVLSNVLAATSKQVDALIVVDNTSANINEIEALTRQADSMQLTDSMQLIKLLENSGLGAAHNVGFDYAAEHGFSHVLILDQDSVPDPEMVANLLAASVLCSQTQQVSAVGAVYRNRDDAASFFIRFGWLKFQRQYCGNDGSDCLTDGVIEADFLISSGSLLSLQSLKEIGNMDESLFIDHVDTEWFLRARSKGYKAYGVCNALMQHNLGETTHRIKIIRERNVPQHKPFRYYYIFRNSILLYKRSYCSWLWKWNDVQRLFMIAIMYGLFCSPRLMHLKMMFSGIKDGLLGRSGRKDFSKDSNA